MITRHRLPEYVTFTGVDERTDLVGLVRLGRHYPVEWGVLFSPKHQGKQNRFPSAAKINEMFHGLARAHGLHFSAHLCGGYSREVMAEGAQARIPIDFSMFQRVQINHADPKPLEHAQRVASWASAQGLQPIMQSRSTLFPESEHVNWLFDRSGGRGEQPSHWPASPPDAFVGYAGGIAPDNVRDTIAQIRPQGPYWLDMEGRVRTDDWFDIELCRQVLEAVYGTR